MYTEFQHGIAAVTRTRPNTQGQNGERRKKKESEPTNCQRTTREKNCDVVQIFFLQLGMDRQIGRQVGRQVHVSQYNVYVFTRASYIISILASCQRLFTSNLFFFCFRSIEKYSLEITRDEKFSARCVRLVYYFSLSSKTTFNLRMSPLYEAKKVEK